MEAITRAQLNLFIVTVAKDKNDHWYQKYYDAFQNAVNKTESLKKEM